MDDPVAVIGFALRFPGDAVDEDSFWNIIVQGKSTMTDVPISRYNIDGFCSKNKSNRNTLNCRGGHFVEGDISAFDAPFFAMSSAEAKAMDPQLRLMLETTYHALESAGLSMESVQGSATSVYVGNLTADYLSLFGDDEEVRSSYQATGMSEAMLSNRVSWFYDLRGPSLTLDTACSSSLVGLHLGCQSILQGESEMSLVGGVRLQLNPAMMTLPLARQNFLSPDSLCYSFDDRANGYSRGEGIGMVILKPLSKAIADGNTIRAVIRGTSSNQDGRTPSISQPSAEAQADLIRKAYEAAGLDFKSTQYFEAHGTGTRVGDPIEAQGINAVFSNHLEPDNPLYIGSVKANIGHLESTAGVASVIKAVLALENGIIPPNALLKNLNPSIPAEEWHFNFPTTAIPWPKDGQRRASVNSFGVGGTNAHVVLDDALHYLQDRGLSGIHNTKSDTRGKLRLTNGDSGKNHQTNGASVNGSKTSQLKYPSLLFPLSAADEDGISRMATTLEDHLVRRDATAFEYLQDLAFTLSDKRGLLPWKGYAIGSTVEELRESLACLPRKPVRITQAPEVYFAFTGQGAQWANMGIELMDRYQVFQDAMTFANEYFCSLGSQWSLVDKLQATAPTSKIDSPQLAQPLCTAVQIALVDLLVSWGITPRAVVGHSSGEIAAAYAVGALSKASALRIAYFRGEAATKLANIDTEKGAMLAVALSEADLSPQLAAVTGDKPECLSCGCVNSPQNTTVTGVESYIDALSRQLTEAKVFNRKLNVPVAYHSRQMLKVADEYRAALAGNIEAGSSDLRANSISLISSVTGKPASYESLAQPDYWIQNLVSKVKFSEALEQMCAGRKGHVQSDLTPLTYVIEVGPHSALERPIRETLNDGIEFAYGTVLRRSISPIVTLQSLIGELFVNNLPMKLQFFNEDQNIRRRPKMLLDLPSYPFNHSRSYWLESRLSQNRRTRKKPRHDFLGNPSADWNPLKPKWRFTIRTSDLPWALDHKVDGIVLYPGTGFLVMVIEAVRSLTADISGVTGFRIRDVNILNALVIPTDDDGIETQLHMDSHGSSPNQGFQAWDFNIYSVFRGEWKVHCSGQVLAEISEATDHVSEKETASYAQSLSRDLEAFWERKFTSHGSQKFYKHLEQQGYHFGENFTSLHDIKVIENELEAAATVNFGHFREQARRDEVSEHLIHPATLDSLFHVMIATQYNGVTMPRTVPIHLSEVFVSLDELGDSSMDTMHLHSKVVEWGALGITGNITAISGATRKPTVTMRGCRFSTLKATGDQRDVNSESTHLFHHMHWKPDISLLSRSQTENYLRDKTKDTIYDDGDIRAEIICRHYMSDAFQDTSDSGWSTKPHMIKYVKWARDFNTTEGAFTAALIEKEWPSFKGVNTRPRLIDEWAKSAPWRAGIVLFWQNLVPILREEVDPLDVLFNQGVAEAIYRSPLLTITASRLAAYIDLVAHKNSAINILEVGAGTGSTTSSVLETLYRQGRSPGTSPRFNRYDFTDISPSFFAQAQERYAEHANNMRFKVLDLERDPAEQGFELGSYDVVIAAAVLHATASIEKTLSHVKKLLKPGGRLVFSEPTNLAMAATSGIFGVLPGWWLSIENYRTDGPLMDSNGWNEAVMRAGFGELQVSLTGDVGDTHAASLLVTRLQPPLESIKNISTAILVQTPSQLELSQSLKMQLDSKGRGSCDIITMESLADVTSTYSHCISLLELEEPVLSRLDESRFANFQDIIRKFKHILWVSTNCGTQADSPESVMMAGFAKAMVREDPNGRIVYLNVNSAGDAVATITRVMEQIREVPGTLVETDLLEEDGIVHIPRVVEAPRINGLLDSTLRGLKPEPVDVDGDSKDAVELRFSPGQLDSFHFGPDTSHSQPLADDAVLIKVKATGINFRDVMVVLNQLSSSELSTEVAGVVAESGAASGFSPGDRVCTFGRGGGFRTYVRAKKSQVMKIPPSMSFAEASAIPLAYVTAQYALCHVGRLKAGESVLIHAAAGGVGQAAIQIAQHIGAVVYVTVGSPEKKQLLMGRYGVEATHCFSSRHVSFAQRLLQATAGKGVDVVLNSLSGLALTETWRCIAPLGRFVEIGKRDMLASKNLPMDPFQRNVSYSSVDLGVLYDFGHELLDQVMREVQTLVLDESTRKLAAPYPVTAFRLSEVEKAFRWLQTGQHTGKAVITWEEQDTIKMIPKSPLDYTFDENSTYVITGGLGGIGRSLASWMASLGARHLVLLSRSGVKSDNARDLVEKLEKDGVRVYAPPCDVSKADEVEEVVAHVNATMPPIKGCIHGALVVKNRMFLDYPFQEFQDNLDPKIQGTWNLHHSLPTNLDFFVLLSSIAGVNGAASQSPYCGASIFQDAFARYRHARGQPCISLDLGVVREVGYVAERVDVARFLARSETDHKVLTESEMQFMLKYACSPHIATTSPWETQVIGALTTPAFIRSRGTLEAHMWMRLPMFCHIYQMEQEVKVAATVVQADSVESQLAKADSIAEATEVIIKAVAKRLARSLAVPVKDIDVSKPPFAFGVDSLVAVELMSWLANEIRADIPVIQILGNYSVAQLGSLAAGVSAHVPTSVRAETGDDEKA